MIIKNENTFRLQSDASISGYYQQLEFWNSDHMIALTFCENYFLEIWNWRNRTQLFMQKTDFLLEHQFIQ